MMTDKSATDVKTEELKKRLSALCEELEAAERDYASTSSSADRVIIKRRIKDLKKDIRTVEEELASLQSEVIDSSDPLSIPFVIAALTADEVLELITERVFNSEYVAPVEQAYFQELKRVLGYDLLKNALPDFYGKEREDWKPKKNSLVIKENIQRIIHLFNQRNDHKSSPLLPTYYSTQFFGSKEYRRSAWEKLSKSGGVLIINSISLFHPRICHYLLKSELGANKRVAIAMVSPPPKFAVANELVMKIMEKRLERLYSRYNEGCELCNLELAATSSALKHWMTSVLSEVGKFIKEHPDPNYLKKIRSNNPSPGLLDDIYWMGKDDTP